MRSYILQPKVIQLVITFGCCGQALTSSCTCLRAAAKEKVKPSYDNGQLSDFLANSSI